MNLLTPIHKTQTAGADLVPYLNRFGRFDANKRVVLATTGNSWGVAPYGVITNTARSLQAVAMAIRGFQDVWAASTLAPGDWVTTNSVGQATVAASGDVAVGYVHQWSRPLGLAEVELIAPFRLVG